MVSTEKFAFACQKYGYVVDFGMCEAAGYSKTSDENLLITVGGSVAFQRQ